MLKLFLLFFVFFLGCASTSSSMSAKATIKSTEMCGCDLTCVKENVESKNRKVNYEVYLRLCNN